MLRNYLAAALRNLSRNGLYAGVTIAGLAVGFAAAMLVGLYVRDEYSYDKWIPGHERVYRVGQHLKVQGAREMEVDYTPMSLAAPLKLDFPEIESVTRLSSSYFPPTVRRGEVTAAELQMMWADPDFFRVLPLPAIAGDLSTALAAPDSVVLTRAIARKYFGRDAPVGETLLVEKVPMRVTAVIEDLPSNTHMQFQLLGAAKSPLSPISQFERVNGPLTNTLSTYFRLREGARIEPIAAQIDAFADRRLSLAQIRASGGTVERKMRVVPIADIHLRPSQTAGLAKPFGDARAIAGIGVAGGLIVLIAAINFVTLMTARAARRAVEVGVRKAAGARRRDLVLQFMGEAMLHVLLAGLLAMAIAELTLPAFNALLQRQMTFDYTGDPRLALALAAALVLTGLLAGAYPAFALSAFRPAAVLKGGPLQSAGGGRLREALVVVQFAVLITLVIFAVTVARQTWFALNEGTRVDKDQVAVIFTRPCSTVMRDELAKRPEVKGVACVTSDSLNLSQSADVVTVEGRRAALTVTPSDFGFFELFGIEPLAGRLFDKARPGDWPQETAGALPTVIVNESAVRKMGFRSAQEAVGATVSWRGVLGQGELKDRPAFSIPETRDSRIVGVVPDFTFGSIRQQIEPTLYFVGPAEPPFSIGLAVKIDGEKTPEAMAAIDRLWKRVGGGAPMIRTFLDQFMLRYYVDTLIQGVTIAVAAIIALSIAALGLFALSAFTTERRTKEIGVRKAMGASAGDILKLLLWQFSKPVLLANLIAWPVGYLVMSQWLKGFAYRVDIAPWTFLAASAGALVIALATVFVHASRVARAKPVNALRYE